MRKCVFRPKLLSRMDSIKRIKELFTTNLMFISAPMGYGKTTMIKQYAASVSDEKFIIWISILGREDDYVWIWNKFVEELCDYDHQLGKKLKNFGFPKNVSDIHKIISIIEENLKEQCLLVLDDWHNMRERKSIFEDFFYFISLQEKSKIKIMVITREYPSGKYIELVNKQKCIIIDQKEIEFTKGETKEFFLINGFNLCNEEMNYLYLYTEGWCSATYLALLQYYEEQDFTNIPKAQELIDKVIFSRFDQEMKMLLMKLATVETFTIEQACYITKNNKVGALVRELKNNNCFIKYDAKNNTYTIHSILRNVLLDKLLYSDINTKEIYDLCGQWYLKNGQKILAIKNYCKGENYEKILEIMDEVDAAEYIEKAPNLIRTAFEKINMEQKLSRPIAYLIYLSHYIVKIDVIEGSRLLKQVKEFYLKSKFENRNRILGEIAIIESYICFFDVEQTLKKHRKAYELLQGKSSVIVKQKFSSLRGMMNSLMIFYTKGGQLGKIIEKVKNESTKYYNIITNSSIKGNNNLLEAEYYLLTCEFRKSELSAYRALYKAQMADLKSIMIASIFVLLRIHIDEPHVCRELLKKLMDLYDEGLVLAGREQLHVTLSYFYGINGDIKNMDKWMIENEKVFNPNKNAILIGKEISNYIPIGINKILKRQYIELEIHTENMINIYKQINNLLGFIYAYMFKAVAEYNLGKEENAVILLMKAVNIAKQDKVILPFIEMAPHIINILNSIEEKDQYVESIYNKCKKFLKVYKKNFTYFFNDKKLTARECEIMEYYAEGCTQQEIADKLHLSLITIKKHLSIVYSKLDVKNKTQALKKWSERTL